MPLSSILWQPVVLVVELGNKEYHEKTIALPQDTKNIIMKLVSSIPRHGWKSNSEF